MFKPWPYLAIFQLPISVLIGYGAGGGWTFLPALLVFGIIPVVDLLIGVNKTNPDPAREEEVAQRRGFRYITWACAPVQVALVVWGASVIAGGHLSALETVGLVFGIGLSSGALGINVAHELVHKHVRFENALGYAMLVSVFYTHWGLEHVKGHHRWVATERDPATARFGQSFYAFWPQTVFGAFVSSWRIEKHLLSRKGHGAWTWRNKVLQGLAAQAVFVVLLGRTWGAAAVAYYAAQSLVAISLLEIVNYLEHYGLTRKALGPDQFERVTPLHSWNASNALTNYFLFNLQRHSDHHAKPARRYPILRHFDESPQLPTGYAGMVLLAAVPPLWRAVMDRRVRAHRAKVEAGA